MEAVDVGNTGFAGVGEPRSQKFCTTLHAFSFHPYVRARVPHFHPAHTSVTITLTQSLQLSPSSDSVIVPTNDTFLSAHARTE